ncbi:MAG: ATP-binding protein [bacterium]
MPTPLVRICITGPECTGKTTLARRLADALGTECVPEGARAYAERVAHDLSADTVEPIAREHIELADAAARRVRANDGTLLVLDTDLVSTIVYGRSYYGFTSEFIEREERARRADLYLLCDVDVPWYPDGIRDRPSDRERMFELFRAALAERETRAVVIRGDWDARWKTAFEATVMQSASIRQIRVNPR